MFQPACVLRHELTDAHERRAGSSYVATQWIRSPAASARRQVSTISGKNGPSRRRFALSRNPARSYRWKSRSGSIAFTRQPYAS